MSDNYFFAEEEIKNAAIRVSIVRWRLLANVFVLVIPVVAYIMARPLLMVFDAIGDSAFPSLFRIFMILTFAIGVWLLIRNAGKEIVVSGRGIIIRKYFSRRAEYFPIDCIQRVLLMSVKPLFQILFLKRTEEFV